MRLLLLVFAASLALLLWAAWAIARAVRGHGRGKGQPPDPVTPAEKPSELEDSEGEDQNG